LGNQLRRSEEKDETSMKQVKHIIVAAFLTLGFWGGPFGSAHAVVFAPGTTTNLENWNVVELQNSDDKVVVQTGTVGGNTAFLVYWDGGTNDTTGAQAIDKFWYDFSCSPSASPCSWLENAPVTTGPPSGRTPYTDISSSPGAIASVYLYDLTAGMSIGTAITGEWDLNGNVLLADGFDMIYSGGRSQTTGNSGNPGGESMDNALLFVLAGVVNSTSMFAVHVRYDGADCSGFAANAELKDGAVLESKPDCVPAPPSASVPEPSGVALLGIALFALAGLGAWHRRRASSQIR
jgi:hypothetical protein